MKISVFNRSFLTPFTVITVAMIIFVGCSKPSADLTEVQQKAETTATTIASSNKQLLKSDFESRDLQWGTLDSTEVTRVVRASGRVDVPPEGRIQLSTLVSGYVHGIELIPGDRLKKGQVLFQLVSPNYLDLQQAYLESKIKFELAEIELKRQQQLIKEQVISESQLQQTKANFDQTKAQYVAMKMKLELLGFDLKKVNNSEFTESLNILSPVDGVVTDIYITSGEFTEASSPMLEIVQSDHLHLELEVFEGEALLVKEGQSLEFRLSGQEYDSHGWMKGEIFRVNSVLNPENRTLSVHGHVEAWDNPLIGAYVEARIMTGNSAIYIVSKKALWDGKNGSEIRYLVKENADSYEWKSIEVETRSIIDAPNEETHSQVVLSASIMKSAQLLSRK
jgi:cobalt-zinc-cadmium efflux system membrane fusion protein